MLAPAGIRREPKRADATPKRTGFANADGVRRGQVAPARDVPLTKNVHIKSYGCQMNVYDATRMADVLAPLGYRRVDDARDADLVILNTCHIREKAAEKVYSELGRLRAMRGRPGDGRTGPMIGVAGCVAQAEGGELLRRAPHVDLVLGPQTYHRLPEMLARIARDRPDGDGGARPGRGIVDTEFPPEPKFDFLPESTGQGPSAFLTVQEGCDRFCAFCVVPYTRGAEYSRPVEAVLDEARNLVAAGARDITLLGQNVNAYHGLLADGRECSLAELIRRMADIPELLRLRYTTSHPRDMTADLIAAHRDVEKLMPWLHLPVQSGSDAVLAAMNRRYRAADYLRIVDDLRAARPDIALSSDFIAGHPGETDADFEKTLDLVRKVEYAQAYSFRFSPRPGTPAAAMEEAVDEDVGSERLQRLQALLADQQLGFNRRFRGRRVPVLFDRRGRGKSQLAGRSPWMQAVHADFASAAEADRAMGRVIDVEIMAGHANSLAARPAGADGQAVSGMAAA